MHIYYSGSLPLHDSPHVGKLGIQQNYLGLQLRAGCVPCFLTLTAMTQMISWSSSTPLTLPVLLQQQMGPENWLTAW